MLAAADRCRPRCAHGDYWGTPLMSKTVSGIAIVVPTMAAWVTLKAVNRRTGGVRAPRQAGEGQRVLLRLVGGFSRLDRPYDAGGEAELSHAAQNCFRPVGWIARGWSPGSQSTRTCSPQTQAGILIASIAAASSWASAATEIVNLNSPYNGVHDPTHSRCGAGGRDSSAGRRVAMAIPTTSLSN